MILKQPTSLNWPRLLLASTILLPTALVAQPTTRPATRPAPVAPRGPLDKLRAALPDGWSLQGTGRISPKPLHPGLKWSPVPATYVKLRSRLVYTKQGMQREARPVIVWLAQRQAKEEDWMATERQLDTEKITTEHLGGGTEHHVYLHLPPDAEKLWPAARDDIAKAMGIKRPTTRPAATTKPADPKIADPKTTDKPAVKRSIIVITQFGDSVSYSVNSLPCVNPQAVGQALAAEPKDADVVIHIETNVRAKHVVEVLTVLQKQRMTNVSVKVIRTSLPPRKDAKPPSPKPRPIPPIRTIIVPRSKEA